MFHVKVSIKRRENTESEIDKCECERENSIMHKNKRKVRKQKDTSQLLEMFYEIRVSFFFFFCCTEAMKIEHKTKGIRKKRVNKHQEQQQQY